MIALPATSQITYIITDKKYVCYTPEENREIAYLIYYGSVSSDLVKQYADEVRLYEDLVLVYKQDSVSCKLIANQLNSKNILLLQQQEELKKEIDKGKVKIKNRNVAIGSLAGLNVLTIILLIFAVR
jgi:hypothetical protein